MAEQYALFDQIIYGTGFANASTWVDLGAIPTGKSIQIGYASYMGVDKAMQFETRSNKLGFSDATDANTDLHDWTGTSAGSNVDRDFYMYGNLETTTVVGTGTEHWWLHITSQSSSSGGYAYIIRYTLQ
jgi:hypothetical protein